MLVCLEKKIAIMQPYFFPYLGYWQLMSMVDEFIVYDNIQFSKRGWIHRNRILNSGSDLLFSLSLKKDSDYLDVNQRFLSKVNKQNGEKIIRQIESSYSKAPYFDLVMPLLNECFQKS